MRVHIHTPSYLPDLVGMTYAADGHASILAEMGWDVTIMVANVPLGEEVAGHGRSWRVIGSGLSGSGLPWSRLKGDVVGLLDLTRKDGADLVLIEGWYTSAAALIPLFKSIGLRVVLASHGAAAVTPASPTPGQVLRAGVLWSAERYWIPKLCRQLDAALVLSEYRGNERFRDLQTYEKLGVPQFHAPNFSAYPFAEGPKTLGPRPSLLHIGEMRAEKGQMHGVEILHKIDERFELVFAFPSENAYSRAVMRRAADLKLQHRIQMVKGRLRHELQACYDAASAFLILSPLREAQPIVAVDGLARAVPFISTPVGCMPEMDGGVISALDAFPARLNALCTSESGYRDMSMRALSYAKAYVSRARAQDGITAMLKAVF